jgi:hypothetical protein
MHRERERVVEKIELDIEWILIGKRLHLILNWKE